MSLAPERLEQLKKQTVFYDAVGEDASSQRSEAPRLSDQEIRILELSKRVLESRSPLRALTPWISSFGLARLLVPLVQLIPGPVIVLAKCDSLRQHYSRFSLKGVASMSTLYPFREWDGANYLPKIARTTERTSVVLVRSVRLAKAWIAENPDALLVVWEDTIPDFDSLELNAISECTVGVRGLLRPEWGRDAVKSFEGCPGSPPPPPPKATSEADAVWTLHAHRLRVASRGILIEGQTIESEDSTLKALADATKNLLDRHDERDGASWQSILLATRKRRALMEMVGPIEQNELDQIPALRLRAESLRIAMRTTWLDWCATYERAVHDYQLRGGTTKSDRILADLNDPDFEGCILVGSERAANILRAAAKAAEVGPERILGPNDIEWTQLLREGKPSGLQNGMRVEDLRVLHLLSPPPQGELGRIARGFASDLKIYVYPHEMAALHRRARQAREFGVAHRPHRRGQKSTVEALNDDVLPELLDDLYPRPMKVRTSGDDSTQMDDRELSRLTGRPVVRLKTPDGELVYLEGRRVYVLRGKDVNLIPVTDLKRGDSLVDMPSLSGVGADLVRRLLQEDEVNRDLVAKSTEWREVLQINYQVWPKRGQASVAAFLAEQLPSVRVLPDTVVAWLTGETELPHDENARALLMDLRFDDESANELIEIHAKYRGLRARAQAILRLYLTSAFRARQGLGADPDETMRFLQDEESLRQAISEHVAAARLIPIDDITR